MPGDAEHGGPQHPEDDAPGPGPEEERDGAESNETILLGQANLVTWTERQLSVPLHCHGNYSYNQKTPGMEKDLKPKTSNRKEQARQLTINFK